MTEKKGDNQRSLSHRFYIARPDLAAAYYEELQQRFRTEWPEIQPMDTAGDAVPKPAVALTSSDSLAGGLSFIAAKSPLNDRPAIWVNAVLVEPGYRRRGLGSRLIVAAQESARRFGAPRLYALTELPALYSRLKWSILSRRDTDFIMTWDSGDCRMIKRIGETEILPRHKAICHCGSVVLELDLPEGIVEPRRCDCSICRRKGAITASVPLSGLKILKGADVLTLYQFNTNTAKHFFCSVCGIYTHHQRRSNPQQYGFNVGCLEGVNPFDLGEVVTLDGVDHPSDRGSFSARE